MNEEKYGSTNNDAVVHNEILGITTPKEIGKWELKGAIKYKNGNWFLTGKHIYVDSFNKEQFHKDRHIGEKLWTVSDEARKMFEELHPKPDYYPQL